MPRDSARVSANCSLLQRMHDADEIFAPVAMAAKMASSLASGAPPSPAAASLDLAGISLDPEWQCEVEWVGCEASPYDRCEESRCCAYQGFGCYKRPHLDYGQCRPLDAGCVDGDEWRCPGSWESCQPEPFGECTDTRCCSQPGFACFKRPFADYAQCRPQAAEEAAACEDDASWLCPGHWEHCGRQHGECSASRCCDDADFGCFRRVNSAYAECRPRQPRGCADDDDWLCPSSWKRCTAADADCSATRCCAFGYGCARRAGTQVGVCKAMPTEWLARGGNASEVLLDKLVPAPEDDGAEGSVEGSEAQQQQQQAAAELVAAWESEGWVAPSGWEYPACSHGFDECTSTRCCADAGYGCFMKRDGRDWAQCRPLSVLQHSPQDGGDGGGVGGDAAAEAAEWLAPGEWEVCAADYSACAGPLCCASPFFGCYRSAPDPSFAQCRPVPLEGEADACDDSAAWLCPGWEACAAPLGDCLASMCCQQPRLFTCYARDASGASDGDGRGGGAALHASCLRTGTCEHEWGAGALCTVHQPSPLAPPSPPPRAEGSGGDGGGAAELDYAQARLAQETDGYAASSAPVVAAVVGTTAAVCGVALCAALGMLWQHLLRREASYGRMGMQPGAEHGTATRRAAGVASRMMPVGMPSALGARAAIGPHGVPDGDDTAMPVGEEAAPQRGKPEWDGALSTVQVVRVERRGAASAGEADGTELVAAK